MKTAVLGNGPSRTLFKDPQRYDYIIGCNIPWTSVHSTVVLDAEVVRYWIQHKLPTVPIYFSESAWRETRVKDRNYFIDAFLELVKPYVDYDSSAHVACRKVIQLGATEIDIYGCDSWFTTNTDSYTRSFFEDSTDKSKHVYGWRNRWQDIIDSNPNVKINFIRN